MHHMFDIGVIGGGLGGLTLALQAAQLGYRVVLWEKETYPFHKVCGEYISHEALPFLERCGLSVEMASYPRIHRLEISSPSGKVFGFDLDGGGMGVSRYALDHLLYQACVAAGVSVHTATKVQAVERLPGGGFAVQVLGQDQAFTAKVLVGAFGKRANLDVQWKRDFAVQKPGKAQHHVGIKYHLQLDHDPEVIALHHFPGGYCGMSAIEDGRSCLCYLTTAQNLASHGGSIEKMEAQVLATNPRLAEIFAQARFLYAEPLAISQISFAPKEQVHEGVLLVGDAAGLITPLCGNGMSMAMQAGVLALEQIHLFLQGKVQRPQMEAAYAAAWQKHFKWRTRAGRFIQNHLNGASGETWMRLLHAAPFVSKKVIGLTHGKPF